MDKISSQFYPPFVVAVAVDAFVAAVVQTFKIHFRVYTPQTPPTTAILRSQKFKICTRLAHTHTEKKLFRKKWLELF